MTFKIEKNVPTRKFYKEFTDALDKLDVSYINCVEIYLI